MSQPETIVDDDLAGRCPLDWYASFLFAEAQHHRRRRRHLRRRLQRVSCVSPMSIHRASEWSSAAVAQRAVTQYIARLPASTSEPVTAAVTAIQLEKLRAWEETRVWFDAVLKRLLFAAPSPLLRGGKGREADGVGDAVRRALVLLSPVPPLLDLCDAMDGCRAACEDTRARLRQPRRAVREAVGALALARRRANLAALRDVLLAVDARRREARAVRERIRSGHFADALRRLRRLPPAPPSGGWAASRAGAAVLREQSRLRAVGARWVRVAVEGEAARLLDRLARTHTRTATWPLRAAQGALQVAMGAAAFGASAGESAGEEGKPLLGVYVVKAMRRAARDELCGKEHSSLWRENGTATEMHGTLADIQHGTRMGVSGWDEPERTRDNPEEEEEEEEEEGEGDVEEMGATDFSVCVAPLEMRQLTMTLLTRLSGLVRAALRLERFYSAATTAQVDEAAQESPLLAVLCELDWHGEASDGCVGVLQAVCKNGCGIGAYAALAAIEMILTFQAHLPLASAPLSEALQTSRLLLVFVESLRSSLGESQISMADAAIMAIEGRVAQLVKEDFANASVEALKQLLCNDTCQSMRVADDDIPELFALLPRSDTDMHAEVRMYFTVPSGVFDSTFTYVETPSQDEAVALNPFMGLQAEAREAAPADKTQPLRFLARDGVMDVFTFSTLMMIKMMVENTTYAQVLRRAALALVRVNLTLVSVYMWYIIAYFVSSDDKWIFHSNANATLKQFAGHIRDHFVPPTFSWASLESSPCLAWKALANSRRDVFAAAERATGLCSLPVVASAFKATVTALGPLLPVEQLSPLAAMRESLRELAAFVRQRGLRVLSAQLLSPESLAAAMEHFRWDGAARQLPNPNAISSSVGGDRFSPPVQQAMEALRRCQSALREHGRAAPGTSLKHLLDHLILNVVMGFVEGVARVRRVDAQGWRQLEGDAALLGEELCQMQPTLQRRRISGYVRQYTSASAAAGVAATAGTASLTAELVSGAHELYTRRQLMALAARDAVPSRGKALEQLIARMHERDEVPFCLIEEDL